LRRLLDREGLGVEVLKLDEPFMKAVSPEYSVVSLGEESFAIEATWTSD
jgi:hypothetical protein